MILPVILSGGAGTRLWPLSRELYPKQLLPLLSEQTMLQETVLRLEGLTGLGEPLVVCNDAHRFMVAEQLRQVEHAAAAIMLEPVGRNTAPAVALAALQAQVDGDDPLLLVLPADHAIRDTATLHRAIEAAADFAAGGGLLTFGIVPTAPETGYGYIRRGARCEARSANQPSAGIAKGTVPARGLSPDAENTAAGQSPDVGNSSAGLSPESSAYRIAEFVEKPDLATAERYLASGDYFWNSGMFLFRASTFLAELERQAPAMLAACRAAWEGRRADLDFVRIDADAFAACPADSIDYAVMEKTDRGLVVPLDAGWSDVGSWAALWENGTRDDDGNLLRGDVLAVDSRDTFVHAGTRLVATVGLEEMVVVETADAVLVAARDRVQDVKQVVARLQEQERPERLLHRRVNRPWGAYEGLDAGDRFLVKRITVNPGASLSLQRHRHRAEHWVVVRGTARVTCDDRVLERTENQSFFIPIGAMHRLENHGDELLEIIEVQTGALLSEEDIERFEDEYGR